MNTCEYAGEPWTTARSHPWTHASDDSAARYYDFTANPALIRSALEAFVPWQRYSAVQDFYSLLELLNRRTSTLESNDCAFSGPAANDTASVEKAFSCSGRVMVLFRALEENVIPGRVAALSLRLHRLLAPADPGFRWGIVGTSIVPVRYLGLPERSARGTDAQLGEQLMISFWAFGDDEPDTMSNLRRVLANLTRALRSLCSRLG